MSPQEKAINLIELFGALDISIIAKCDNSPCIPSGCMTYISAISCAIIAVDEIIKANPIIPLTLMLESEAIDEAIEYWQEVTQDLIKLKNK